MTQKTEILVNWSIESQLKSIVLLLLEIVDRVPLNIHTHVPRLAPRHICNYM